MALPPLERLQPFSRMSRLGCLYCPPDGSACERCGDDDNDLEAAAGRALAEPVLELTVDLSALTGIWKTVYGRQDDLYAAQSAKAARLWRKIVKGLDIAALVASFRREALMTSDGTPAPGTDHPTPQAAKHHKTQVRLLAASLAAGMLAAAADSPSWPDLLAAVTTALTLAAGEGYASALAVAAAEAGAGGLDWDTASTDGRKAPSRDAVNAVAAAVIAGAATDLAVKLASLAIAGATAAAMTTAGTAVLTAGRALSVYLPHAMAASVSAAMRQVYDTARVRQLSWITAGDRKVCPVCEGYEARNPWRIAEFPALPAHPGCRCTSGPAGDAAIPDHFYAAYLAV